MMLCQTAKGKLICKCCRSFRKCWVWQRRNFVGWWIWWVLRARKDYLL